MGQLHRCIGVVLQSFFYPLNQKFEFLGVLAKTLPALMGNLRGRFEQNKTLTWVEGIRSTAKLVMSERMIIGIWRFASKRKFEASFAIGVAMTSPGITSALGNDWHHIIPKGNLSPKRQSDRRPKEK